MIIQDLNRTPIHDLSNVFANLSFVRGSYDLTDRVIDPVQKYRLDE